MRPAVPNSLPPAFGKGIHAWIGVWIAALLLTTSGCAPPKAKYPTAFNSQRPDHRIWAIQRAGERRDREAAGILVDRLGDDDEAVRLYAILALERISGTRLGYNYRAPEPERVRAMARWRQYLAGEIPTSQPATRESTRD